jgi:hypothetical protein
VADAALSRSAFRDALSAYRDEAGRLSTLWRDLDSKAQTVVAVAGIFIAATFAYVRDVPASFGLPSRFTVAAALALLVAAVICAVLAARVRRVTSGLTGKAVFEMTCEVLEAAEQDDDLVTREVNLLRDQCKLWQETTGSLSAGCTAKARLIHAGQLLVALAGAIVAVLAIARLLFS